LFISVLVTEDLSVSLGLGGTASAVCTSALAVFLVVSEGLGNIGFDSCALAVIFAGSRCVLACAWLLKGWELTENLLINLILVHAAATVNAVANTATGIVDE
jgi:hypothetical protein